MKHKGLKLTVSVIVLILALAVVWLGGIIMASSASDVPIPGAPPDYIIVLGSGIKGEEPSESMTERVQMAADYLREHPWTMVICSGGQGPDESVPEAKVIVKELQKRGVAPRRILVEDTSANTYENFLFSQKLLQNRVGDKPLHIAFVTNDYHVYRSRNLAKLVGFENPIAISAESSSITFYPGFIRECAAVIKSWVKFKWFSV